MNEYDIRVLIYTVAADLEKEGFDVRESWCSTNDRVASFRIIKDGVEAECEYNLTYASGVKQAKLIEEDLVNTWCKKRQLNVVCPRPQKISLAVDFRPQIEKVIFNNPATIVFWKDGSKTITKCGELDIYDPEKGLAMCFAKRLLGNEGNYYNVFTEWLPKEEENDIEYGAPFDEPFRQVKEACNKLYDKIAAGNGGH